MMVATLTLALAGSPADLRACYRDVARCLGVKRPGRPPRVRTIPPDPADPRGGFACGTVCTVDETGAACVPGTTRTAFCNGLTDRGQVYAVAGKPHVIPHEFVHVVLARQHRRHPRSARWLDDGSHTEPAWALGCEHKEQAPACSFLWPASLTASASTLKIGTPEWETPTAQKEDE